MNTCNNESYEENTCVKLSNNSSSWEISVINDLSQTNDVWMPIWGLGMSYQQESYNAKETLPYPSVCTALDYGYRLFDTASR